MALETRQFYAQVTALAQAYSDARLTDFLRLACGVFRPADAPLPDDTGAFFLGSAEFADGSRLLAARLPVHGLLTSHSGKRAQFDAAVQVLKAHQAEAGLFAFVDAAGRFRLSLVRAFFTGTRRTFSDFRRFTFFVEPQAHNRTFIEQLSGADFSSIEGVARAFSVEAVTQAFYRKYKEVFDRAEADTPASWLPAQRRLYTQRFFNRLMFLAFLERKGWLHLNAARPHGRSDYLQTLWEDYRAQEGSRDAAVNFHRSRLNTLFFFGLNHPHGRAERERAEYAPIRRLIGSVPYLNGGLFEREADDETHFFDDAIVQAALTELVYAFNFTVAESTPLDVEVAVDPEMLGKIFEELVTGRHESGSYYTPRPVVGFMCRQALLGFLQTALPREPVEMLTRFVEQRDSQGLQHPEAALDALRRVKVCDPACGSGAYLLGMLHELLDLRAALFTARRVDTDSVYARKLEIIQNNLYGVDLDPFAVNIARLRLWLSLIVEYEGDDPPPLPNLDFKIETGDSLLAPDPSGGLELGFRRQLISEFLALKDRFLTLHAGQVEKDRLRAEIDAQRTRIKEWLRPQEAQGFDWAVEFAEVFLSLNAATGEGGGFDVVLANPPYVRQELIKDLKPALKRTYGALFSGTADLYVYFYVRAQQLLKANGVACFISSNKWLRAGYGEKLRQHLLDAQQFLLVADFGELPVFQTAATFPAIFVWRKAARGDAPTRWAVVQNLQACYDEGIDAHLRARAITLPAAQFGAGKARLQAPAAAQRRREMQRGSVPLGEYVDGKIYFGIKTGLNAAFYIDEATRTQLIQEDPRSAEIIQPLLVGDDVRRYEAHYRGRYIIFARRGIDIQAYPAAYQHLLNFRTRLEPRPDNWDTAQDGAWQGRKPGSYAWYELQDSVDYYPAFQAPKIIYPMSDVKSKDCLKGLDIDTEIG
ncbi:MAG: hypothetical protein OHK0052_20970 [Anaerolineales bacterium]